MNGEIERHEEGGAAGGGTRRGAFAYLFLFILSIYFLCASGHPYSIDGISTVAVSQSLIAGRGLAAAPDREQHFSDMKTFALGRDGRYYSKYGPVHSILLTPFAFAGDTAARIVHISPPDPVVYFFAGFFNSIPTALTCLLIAAICMNIGLRRRTALISALVYGFCTMAFPYAKYCFSEPLVGLTLTAAMYFLLDYEMHGRTATLAVAGAVLGISPLIKISSGIAFPIVGAAAIYVCFRNKQPWRALVFLAPAACGLLMLGVYNFVIFGSPLTTGYAWELPQSFTVPMYEGIYGMLFSGSKGMFFYSPALALFFFGFRGYFRRWRAGACVGVAMTIVFVVFFSRWVAWGGGNAWGPRHILPALPLLAVGAGCFLETIRGRRGMRYALAVLFITAGCATQIVPVVQKFNIVYENGDAELSRIVGFRPQIAMARRAWRTLSAWPRHLADIFQSGGSFGDLTPRAFIESKALEESPDFWHSLLLYWRIPALTAATLGCMALLAGTAIFCGRRCFAGFSEDG